MSYATRVPSLDGLRGIAAVGVMLFHFNLFFLPQAQLPFVGRAYLAVDLFFLLSGFVMAHVYGRSLAADWRAHWAPYVRARFARIYPLFAVTTLAMMAVLALSRMPLPSVSFSKGSLALQPVLMQQWASGLNWNYPSWSVSTEAECYVAFIFSAGVLMAGKHPRLIVVCCAGVVAALSITRSGSLNCFVGFFALLRALAEFSLGVFLYRAHSDAARFPNKYAIIFAIPLVVLAKTTQMDFFMIGAFVCLIYYAADAVDAVGSLLNSRALSALGNWSYGIYLWHAPTHYAVMASFAAVGHPVGNLSQFTARLLLLATAILAVGFSALMYRYCEMPLRRFILGARGLPRRSYALPPG